MRKFFLKCILLIPFFSFSQENKMAKNYSQQINDSDLRDNLSIIASDALEGRMTGRRGQKMAAAFISSHFQEIGLKGPVNGSYYQPFELYESTLGENYLIAGDLRFENYSDMFFLGSKDSGGEKTSPLIFAGFANNDNLEQIDVLNKSVVILSEDDIFSTFSIVKDKADELRMLGAQAILVVTQSTDSDFIKIASAFKSSLNKGSLSMDKSENDANVFFIKQKFAENIFNTRFSQLVNTAKALPSKKLLKKIKESRITWQTNVQERIITSENVLGYLEGSDKKDELVIITAHYDHIGKTDIGPDKINNGADDDGSGTVALMQMAKAFAQAKKNGNGPRRSILFMAVTGEEEGLFGSEYYVTHPVFPLTHTIVNLNIDMIGRTDNKHATEKNYIYIIGSDKLSQELHQINELANTTYTKLALDYLYNDPAHPERLYYRSDHWNFAKNNIPIIFYFDGIHEDYHKPSDEVGKIDFDLLSQRTQLVFFTAWELANRNDRIALDIKIR